MRKSNFFKTVVCGMMITMIMASTVFAGTVSRSAKVRNVVTYTDVYSGAVGNYTAAGDPSYVRTTVQNTTNSIKYYGYYVYRYNWATQTYDRASIGGRPVANGDITYVAMNGRSMSSAIYDYLHVVQGYASTVYSSATMVDNYTFLAMQYYR